MLAALGNVLCQEMRLATIKAGRQVGWNLKINVFPVLPVTWGVGVGEMGGCWGVSDCMQNMCRGCQIQTWSDRNEMGRWHLLDMCYKDNLWHENKSVRVLQPSVKVNSVVWISIEDRELTCWFPLQHFQQFDIGTGKSYAFIWNNNPKCSRMPKNVLTKMWLFEKVTGHLR